MEPPDAQPCRAGWVMCHEGGAAVAETYWGVLRVSHAPSVKPGAAYCCHCLFAWSPSGTPTSPGPRRRLFNNAGSNAARRSVTLCAQKTTKPDISHEQFTGNPMFFPGSLRRPETNLRNSQGSAQGWHKVEVGHAANSPFRVVGVVSVCC